MPFNSHQTPEKRVGDEAMSKNQSLEAHSDS